MEEIMKYHPFYFADWIVQTPPPPPRFGWLSLRERRKPQTDTHNAHTHYTLRNRNMWAVTASGTGGLAAQGIALYTGEASILRRVGG